MSLKLSKRISLYVIVSTALLIGLLNLITYLIVHKTVYAHIDSDLRKEAIEFINSTKYENNNLIINHPFVWTTGGHGNLVIDPIFVQFSNLNGDIYKKTENLADDKLKVIMNSPDELIFDTEIDYNSIRQIQLPLVFKGKGKVGYISVAASLKDASYVLNNLMLTLIISYPFILIILFVIAIFVTQSSIQPLQKIISITESITKENLNKRIPLPKHNDEIYLLSDKINQLVARLEDAIIREKQFTADASHELRTPLSVLRGTLEVLVRKERSVEHYQEKINYCIAETARMERLIDQLLLLARYETSHSEPVFEKVNVEFLLQDVINRLSEQIESKNITIVNNCLKGCNIYVDKNMFLIVLENLISNSIKYSNAGKSIRIKSLEEKDKSILLVEDEGFGMTEEQISNVFNRFYRGDVSRNSIIKGFGIGMSIVKKLCDIQNIEILIESKIGSGTTVKLLFEKL